MNINASYIHLENILFFAHHGVATQETIVGNEFYINLRLKVGFARAIRGYGELCRRIYPIERRNGNPLQTVGTCMRTYCRKIIPGFSCH